MTDEGRVDGAAAYRGFLFSDIRGFTAFAERHGNSAAAAAVSRFLDIARTAIARHQGAEVKTEGDAIHAVFPSASGAVLCGLEIQDAAAELSVQEPDHRLGLGVGIHAGEAVETAEGYIGRAVNIAARLCAIAKPGEVLVSSTVKGITQSSIQVGFIPRGRRRLKGIQDPILVYAVTRDTTVRPSREVPRFLVVGAAGLALVGVVAIAALAGSKLLSNPGASPAATVATSGIASPTSQPVAVGPLAIGTYESRQFQPQLKFDIADQGWSANYDTAEMLGLIRDGSPRGSVSFLRVGEVISNPCTEGGAGTGPATADVLFELGALAHLTLQAPQPALVGGFSGQQVDVAVSDGVLAACGGLAGGDVALFRVGKEVWRVSPGERFRLIFVLVGDRAVTIVLSTDWTQTHSVKELEDLYGLGRRVLDSVKF